MERIGNRGRADWRSLSCSRAKDISVVLRQDFHDAQECRADFAMGGGNESHGQFAQGQNASEFLDQRSARPACLGANIEALSYRPALNFHIEDALAGLE